MSYQTKVIFINSILTTATESTERVNMEHRRGFITETEKIEELSEIIQKAAEMIAAL